MITITQKGIIDFHLELKELALEQRVELIRSRFSNPFKIITTQFEQYPHPLKTTLFDLFLENYCEIIPCFFVLYNVDSSDNDPRHSFHAICKLIVSLNVDLSIFYNVLANNLSKKCCQERTFLSSFLSSCVCRDGLSLLHISPRITLILAPLFAWSGLNVLQVHVNSVPTLTHLIESHYTDPLLHPAVRLLIKLNTTETQHVDAATLRNAHRHGVWNVFAELVPRARDLPRLLPNFDINTATFSALSRHIFMRSQPQLTRRVPKPFIPAECGWALDARLLKRVYNGVFDDPCVLLPSTLRKLLRMGGNPNVSGAGSGKIAVSLVHQMINSLETVKFTPLKPPYWFLVSCELVKTICNAGFNSNEFVVQGMSYLSKALRLSHLDHFVTEVQVPVPSVLQDTPGATLDAMVEKSTAQHPTQTLQSVARPSSLAPLYKSLRVCGCVSSGDKTTSFSGDSTVVTDTTPSINHDIQLVLIDLLASLEVPLLPSQSELHPIALVASSGDWDIVRLLLHSQTDLPLNALEMVASHAFRHSVLDVAHHCCQKLDGPAYIHLDYSANSLAAVLAQGVDITGVNHDEGTMMLEAASAERFDMVLVMHEYTRRHFPLRTHMANHSHQALTLISALSGSRLSTPRRHLLYRSLRDIGVTGRGWTVLQWVSWASGTQSVAQDLALVRFIWGDGPLVALLRPYCSVDSAWMERFDCIANEIIEISWEMKSCEGASRSKFGHKRSATSLSALWDCIFMLFDEPLPPNHVSSLTFLMGVSKAFRPIMTAIELEVNKVLGGCVITVRNNAGKTLNTIVEDNDDSFVIE